MESASEISRDALLHRSARLSTWFTRTASGLFRLAPRVILVVHYGGLHPGCKFCTPFLSPEPAEKTSVSDGHVVSAKS